MKNIHVLPTDKPTWLHKSLLSGTLRKSSSCIDDMRQSQGMNMYITSEEEIKEGDWCILLENYYVNGGIGKYNTEKAIGYGLHNTEFFKKIILTTDQDLIKKGVQAIDDEFLEWFVNNPSCEKIEVEKAPYDGTKSISKYWGGEYKIIIPKEESKQETLEEVALKYFPKTNSHFDRLDEVDGNAYYRSIFKQGAKWQQEQDKNKYSLQELKLWLAHRDIYLYNYYTTYIKSGIPLQSIEDFIKESHEYLMDRKQINR